MEKANIIEMNANGETPQGLNSAFEYVKYCGRTCKVSEPEKDILRNFCYELVSRTAWEKYRSLQKKYLEEGREKEAGELERLRKMTWALYTIDSRAFSEIAQCGNLYILLVNQKKQLKKLEQLIPFINDEGRELLNTQIEEHHLQILCIKTILEEEAVMINSLYQKSAELMKLHKFRPFLAPDRYKETLFKWKKNSKQWHLKISDKNKRVNNYDIENAAFVDGCFNRV